MADCIFCKIAKGEIPSNRVYEDEKTFVFMDISPVSKGHLLVIPKQHAAKLHELSDDSAFALVKALKKVTLAVEKAFNCDFNILNNTGAKAGQAVMHVHFHIIPRRGEEGEFNYNWPAKTYAEGEDKEILRKIKKSLSNI